MSSPTFPPELIGTIAKNVWEGSHILRQSTIKSCMLVSKTFAKEFRRYLLHTLRFNDIAFPDDFDKTEKHLAACIKILTDNPAYQVYVKNVVIALEPTAVPSGSPYLTSKTTQLSATLLERLKSVESLFIGSPTPDSVLQMTALPLAVQLALLQLTALPSVTAIILDRCGEVSPAYIFRAPNVRYLRLHDVIFPRPPIMGSHFPDRVWPPPTSPQDVDAEQRKLELDIQGVVMGPARFPNFLSGVTTLSTRPDLKSWSLVQEAATAASKSKFLRSLNIEILPPPYKISTSPIVLNLSGAEELRRICIKVVETARGSSQARPQSQRYSREFALLIKFGNFAHSFV